MELYIGNITTKLIDKEHNSAIIEFISAELSYQPENIFFMPLYQQIFCPVCRKKLQLVREGRRIVKKSCRIHGDHTFTAIRLWDGVIRLFNKNSMTFPTGFISNVVTILKDRGVPFKVYDTRVKPELGQPYSLKGIEPRPYQLECINAMKKATRGIVELCTGGGKSLILAKFVEEINVPTLIVVPRLTLLFQLKKDIEEWLGIECGIVGDGYKDFKRITIATLQSIGAAFDSKTQNSKLIQDNEVVREVVKNVSSILIDECHFLKTSTLQGIMASAQNAFYKIGLSATPENTLEEVGQDKLVHAFTGKKIYEKKASDLIEEGYLSQPTIHMRHIKHDAKVLASTRKMKKSDLLDSSIIYAEYYTKAIVENQKRNQIIVKEANQYYQQGKSVLIAVVRKDHGEILLEELKKTMGDDVAYVNGDDDSEELTKTLKLLDEKKLKCVVATTVFGIGVNVKSLDVLVNAQAGDSSFSCLQLIGRVLRITPTKNKVDVVDFYDDDGKYLKKQSENRIKIYKTERAFVFEEDKQVELIKSSSNPLL